MLVSVRFFRNQFSHYLKRVDRRLVVEFVLLFAIFLVFFSEKLIDILNSLLEKPDVSPIGMTIFIEHIVLIPFALTTPFIYTHLLPRQRMLQILRLETPGPTDAFLILFMHYLKYELAVIIILIPVLGAVLFTLNLSYLIHILITAGISLVLILILMHLCAHHSNGKRIKSYALYFTVFAIYFIVFYCLYLNKNSYSVFQASVMIISLVALLISWSRTWKYWDYNLFRLQIIRHKNYSAGQANDK